MLGNDARICRSLSLAAVLALGPSGVAEATIYNGNPSNYLTFVNQLQAGDTLILAPGTYTGGLTLTNKNGTAPLPIIIVGPESGAAAVFRARSCCNTVSITNSSYLEIRNLELDGLGLPGIDAVKGEGPQGDLNFAHHITLENLFIHGHAGDQQTVGISTKCPAWDWVVRGNVIATAGTGMYFGNSDGSAPFVSSLIEGNLVVDTTGYNVQIKHQNNRPALPGMPPSGVTTIRHNVFSKANGASTGDDARPNLLVGHWPLSGNGANDVYQIYGNFFWANPTGEPLFQGEGNVALYQNLFVNNTGPAVLIQPHEDVPRTVRVFNNTVVSSANGIRVSGGNPSFQQLVIGNASFAATPLNVPAPGQATSNVTGTLAAAATFLTNPGGSPTGTPTQLDLYPRPGMLTGPPLDTSSFNTYLDWNRDFNGTLHNGSFRGAYAAAGTNPGWLPRLERKPLTPPGPDVSVTLGDAPDPVGFGSPTVLTAIVSNAGPSVAAAVGLTVQLPVGLSFNSSNPGAPTCTAGGGTVTCALGDLAAGALSTVTVTASGAQVGTHVTTATASATLDPVPGNNVASALTTVVPVLAIGDVSQAEGNATSVLSLLVQLSPAGTAAAAVGFATANGTALAGSDYVATAGTLDFPPGTTSRLVQVPVLGDRVNEPNEGFVVSLSGAAGAVVFDGLAAATLVNDDLPGLSIADVVVAEGKQGNVTATYTFTLSPPNPTQTVTVDYATTPGTATAADFVAAAGTVSFPPGSTTQTRQVTIIQDLLVEVPPETFTVDLSSPVNAGIASGTALTRILDPKGGTDFNSDLRTDLVWRHDTSGENVVWYMNGTALVSGTFTTPPTLTDVRWKIVGTSDFNGDGRSDLLWRHDASGENVLWYMNGVTLVAGTFTTPSALADVRWKMVGTGDFDLDGRPDILWRHDASGENVLWYMNGPVLVSGTFTLPSSLTDVRWKMAGVGDFNRDGRADILWHHTTSGQIVLWYMDGNVLLSGTFATPNGLSDVGWQVVAVGDYNADERPDIVWRHQGSGQNVVWFMDNATLISGTLTTPSALPDVRWRLVGPR